MSYQLYMDWFCRRCQDTLEFTVNEVTIGWQVSFLGPTFECSDKTCQQRFAIFWFSETFRVVYSERGFDFA